MPLLSGCPPVEPGLGERRFAVHQSCVHLDQLLTALIKLETEPPAAGLRVRFNDRILNLALAGTNVDFR